MERFIFFISEQDIVISTIRQLSGYVVIDSVNSTTTHVICGEQRRTLNVLYAIAYGCWLMPLQWVINY